MNCAEVKQRLSAFYDAELSSDESARVADHLDACPDCAQQQHGFQSLSAGVRQLNVAEPPLEIWQRIEEQLDARPKPELVQRAGRNASATGEKWAKYRMLRPALAVAALLLIAIGFFTYETWIAPSSRNVLAADFEQYADEFPRNPDAAQQILLTKYDGRPIDLAEAVQSVSYRPAVADGMPSEYSLDSVHLLKMPCCDCLQTICQRSDGTKIAIFEFGEKQPVSYGDRPESAAKCRGINCCLVEINEQFAVNWNAGDRSISVVGVRDQAEIESLVAWLD